MRPLPAAVLVALALALVAGCGDDPPAADGGSADDPPAAGDVPAGTDRVEAVLDGVPLELEVADDEDERAVGLMRRESVPPGTGMVFLYDEPVQVRFYMYDVAVPLRAVFVRDGTVVSSVLMPPCEQQQPQDCPTYGAEGPFDTVVETAPETLPDVQPGDELVLEP